MPGSARIAPGGVVSHVLNRGNDRGEVSRDDGGYAAFERVLAAALAVAPVRLLTYCRMPDHWHLIPWPTLDGQLAEFMRRLTVTHVRRWHAHRHCTGRGHVYRGTCKSFPVQEDRHVLLAARYVERNALRANLVDRARGWRWCSPWRRGRGCARERGIVSEWPVARPADWLEWVNAPASAAEEQKLQLSLKRGQPFGDEPWQRQAAARLGLEKAFRGRGRPRKKPAAAAEPAGN